MFAGAALGAGQGDFKMSSQKIAGTLAGIIGLIVLAVAFFYGPIGDRNKTAKQVEKNDLAKAPVEKAPARGPVVREIPQQ
jgi:hypothetical protein